MQKQSDIQAQQSQSLILKTPHQKKANKIIKKCLWQNDIFKQQYSNKNWSDIHSSHYDWWAFPIDQPSGYGEEYMVKLQQINTMKNSQQFMKALSQNAVIVCQAWGYDLIGGKLIETNHQDQKWHNWPIRLYKMTKSLEILGLHLLFENAIKYGIYLMKQGKKFVYSRRDLGSYFDRKFQQINERQNKNKIPLIQQKSTQIKSKSQIKKQPLKNQQKSSVKQTGKNSIISKNQQKQSKFQHLCNFICGTSQQNQNKKQQGSR